MQTNKKKKILEVYHSVPAGQRITVNFSAGNFLKP
jgi:hypothetical protein